MSAKGWVFLSHQLNSKTPSYGNRAGFTVEGESKICDGQTANSMVWKFPNHLGTHVDCPRHFFDGAPSVSEYVAEDWVFEFPLVIDCPKAPNELITAADLEKALTRLAPEAVRRSEALLLKTGFEKYRGQAEYWEQNPGIDPDLGPWLREKVPHVKLVGMDVISVTSWKNRELGRVAHRGLLSPELKGNPLRLLEDMSLAPLADKELRRLFVLPLRVEGADGGPCTVLGQID